MWRHFYSTHWNTPKIPFHPSILLPYPTLDHLSKRNSLLHVVSLPLLFNLLDHTFYIAIEFPLHTFLKTLQLFQDNYNKPKSFPLDPSHTNLKHFLLWFRPIPIWLYWLKTYQKYTKPKPNPHIILVFHRPCTSMSTIQYFPYTGILQS